MSSYELAILQILKKEKIEFEREKSFKDLYRGKYRFDFYLPARQVCIEIDGEQHFIRNKKFHKWQKDFEKMQEHDRRKNSYCLAHNIKLYRIPYWEIKNIKCFNDIFNQKFLVTSMWHNDTLKVPN